MTGYRGTVVLYEEVWSGILESYISWHDMYESSMTLVSCAVGLMDTVNVKEGLNQGAALTV